MNRRLLAVIALSLLSIALWAPDVKRAFGQPVGMTPAPLYRGARIKLDRIDLGASPLVMRLRWLRNNSCWMSSPGQICDFAVRTESGTQHVIVPAPPENPINGPIVLVRDALALAWLFCAALFLLLRPSPATWSFFASRRATRGSWPTSAWPSCSVFS